MFSCLIWKSLVESTRRLHASHRPRELIYSRRLSSTWLIQFTYAHGSKGAGVRVLPSSSCHKWGGCIGQAVCGFLWFACLVRLAAHGLSRFIHWFDC